MIGVETGLGLLLSLVTFLRAELSSRWTKEEILRVLEDAKTIQQYLEWLRRQDQENLVREIENSKGELLREIAGVGAALETFANAVRAQAGDLERRIHDLNQRLLPPVLSPLSLPTRPRLALTLRGRDRELQWLLEHDDDALVVGQPGSGKTELLHALAELRDAKFLLSDDPDVAAAALLARPPAVVIVDDAGLRGDLLLRLRHVRSEQALGFHIIAVCWPFETEEVQQTLQVREVSVLHLEGLPRPVIVEIIKDVTTAQNVRVNDEFVRVVAKQARGKPGLAASLSLATIGSSGEALLSGELLLKDLSPFVRRVVGDEAVHLLAAFACGGTIGSPVAAVAKQLGKSVLDVAVSTQRIALAGVLEQTGKATLCVQPSFLRSALIKTIFFPAEAVPLPWDVGKAVIESLEDPVVGYLEVIAARRLAGAAVDDEMLHEIATRFDEPRLWEALAELDQRNCEWVVTTKGAVSAGIKRAALRYGPEAVIPQMLQAATLEKRPLNSIPNGDMRILQDWVVAGSGRDAISRRRTLFDAVVAFMPPDGSVSTAFDALRSVFSLDHHESDSDPANPRTIRFRHSLVSLNAAKEIFAMWQALLEASKALAKFPWPGVSSLVENWVRAGPRGEGKLPPDYVDFLRDSSREMVSQLIPLADGHQAALRWLQSLSTKLGVPAKKDLVSADFMTIYPDERLEGDWLKRDNKQDVRAAALADSWQRRPFHEIVATLSEWERQADELGRVWPRKTSIFCGRLAELVEPTNEELAFAIENLPAMALEPFLNAALTRGRLTDEQLRQCSERWDLTGILIAFTLKGRTPQLYDELKSRLPTWIGLVEGLCIRNEVPAEMLQKLLTHDDLRVRLETALYTFRSKSEGAIPEAVSQLWYDTLVAGLSQLVADDSGEAPYDLRALFARYPMIAQDVLENLLASGSQLHGLVAREMLHIFVANLGKEDRRKLLHRSKHLVYSPLPALLVSGDEDLYRELLGIAELADFHLSPLEGDPNNPNWIRLAKLALGAGHSHKAVARATEPSSFGWTGGLSAYYQEWVERFELLRQSTDRDAQQIAEEALKSFIRRRDREKKQEQLEEILGID